MQLFWPDDSGAQDYLSGPFSLLSPFSCSHQYWPNSESEIQTAYFSGSLIRSTSFPFFAFYLPSPVSARYTVFDRWFLEPGLPFPHPFWLKLLTFFKPHSNATSFMKASMHPCYRLIALGFFCLAPPPHPKFMSTWDLRM